MKNTRIIRSITFALILLGMAFAPFASSTAAAAANYSLKLKFSGLEDLGPGFVYEGWLIVAGAPISSGRFTISADGLPSNTTFTVNPSARPTAFVLTIEPEPDADPNPSLVHLLAGDFMGRNARLAIDHAAAFGDSFRQAAGSYILGVPSDQSGGTPYTNGIWWLDPAGGPGPALSLPVLPAGWVYEGWVAGPAGPISTGTFLSPDGADSDAGGPYAGPDATPPFPGQDFVNPAMSLIGQAAVISIEPVPDNGTAPFFLKPLVDTAIEDLGAAGLLQSMENQSALFPKGMASLNPAP